MAADLETALKDLRHLAVQEFKLQQELGQLSNSGLSQGLEDEQRNELELRMKASRERFRQMVEETVRFPPYHARHLQLLNGFWQKGTYDKSVFIMTKFPPDPGDPAETADDQQLRKVIQTVSDSITAAGWTPRIASEQAFHPALWDNVELFLLACSRGVAIVEDRCRPELNPNVAMEWGWMRGMGKRILFLVESKFNHLRADWNGLIRSDFTWETPDLHVPTEIKKFLT